MHSNGMLQFSHASINQPKHVASESQAHRGGGCRVFNGTLANQLIRYNCVHSVWTENVQLHMTVVCQWVQLPSKLLITGSYSATSAFSQKSEAAESTRFNTRRQLLIQKQFHSRQFRAGFHDVWHSSLETRYHWWSIVCAAGLSNFSHIRSF